MTLLARWVFGAWDSGGQTLGGHPGSPPRATPELEILLPLRQCMPGTRCTNSGTATHGSGVVMDSKWAAISIGIRGRCGGFSRTAATISTPTATQPNWDLMMGAVPGS